MTLTKYEFEVLFALAISGEALTQRQISERRDVSLGSVNAAVASCERRGFVQDRRITEAGIAALEPYKVDNAIIMAAGLSSRFAPISYEKPKGMLKVRDEVLVERQIRQLLEVGVSDITMVVGYMKEYFFYLRAKYGVDIVVNPYYATRNNNSTLWLVKDRLRNTFICSSDDYFIDNPFERYVYQAYYASQYVEGPTDEWCLTTGTGNRITDVTVGGSDAWVMLGHVYFNRAFSEKFVQILEEVYDLPETADKLWEGIYADHIKQLKMVLRPYETGFINEFDSLDELSGFDPAFIENVDSDIFDNIVSVLDCKKSEIHDFYPLKQGLTNLSCHFAVGDEEYVYRHPGVGTEQMIDREAEEAALRLARDLGIDDTFIFEDPAKGWKISKFIPGVRNLDPYDSAQVKRAMQVCRKVHDCGATLDREFDFYQEGLGYEKLLAQHGPIDVPGYTELKDKVSRLKTYADADGYPTCLNHNDFFFLNFLVDKNDELSLIDWEYAGMSDVANDFGTFTVCCQLSTEQADEALDFYFGRPASFAERRHFWAYVVFAGWCWYIWALAKEAEGDNVGEWLFIYYKYAVDYIDQVLDWYESADRYADGRHEANNEDELIEVTA
ncbi:phosphotransferase [Propionimicrobium sp. PCR01-08-3]|uniref:phosphotransferase n=1 Tax=Propionimicrobium sp. PCR01-08-3 TaxID=3052086 RepID=UPI00255D0981|nr:phosphotransferase [Propionimicrobium sp. PCR01-08-3]WIY82620.1 phosphotransferase [Propionimicrobium sp. PCR01-08-3]